MQNVEGIHKWCVLFSRFVPYCLKLTQDGKNQTVAQCIIHESVLKPAAIMSFTSLILPKECKSTFTLRAYGQYSQKCV